MQYSYLEQLDWLHDLGIGTSRSLRDLAWQYLDSALMRYDSSSTSFTYRKIVLEKILRDEGPEDLPGFLLQFYMASVREVHICKVT